MGELANFTDLLAEDVSMTADGGGKASAATRPLVGRDAVGRFCLGLMKRMPASFTVEIHQVNGRPAVMISDPLGTAGVGFSLVSFEMDDADFAHFRSSATRINCTASRQWALKKQ
ncbi:MAG: hypothetical protein QM755_12160 [Luteolibacter sp.]